ncbi:MAG: serine/threonine-protein kinase [Planctomycetota bacterium]
MGDKLSTDAKSGIEDLASLRRLLGPSDDPRMMGRIGTYEIVGLLGQGGMGVVFKAFDPSLNRYVAIKMLAPMLMPSVVFKQRFLREAQSAAAVVHDNVVGIHAISEWQGIPYLVMTFVRGKSLQSRLRDRGHLSLREALRIGSQISAGLDGARGFQLLRFRLREGTCR